MECSAALGRWDSWDTPAQTSRRREGAALLDVSTVDPLADAHWDRFVGQHPDATVFHLSAWERVLRRTIPGLTSCCKVLGRPLDDRWQAVLPLFEVPCGLTGRKLVSVPRATFCDPLASSELDLDLLLRSAVAEVGARHARRLEIHACHAAARIHHPGFTVQRNHVHHFLSLRRGLDDLFAACDGGCVRNRVRKALNSGLVLRRAETETDARAFYELHCQTRHRLGLPVPAFSDFSASWDVLAPLGEMETLLAEHQGTLVAGLLLLKWRRVVAAEILAYRESALPLCPNHFLFWRAIERAQRDGYEVFDFGRTPLQEKGLMAFKGHWGTSVGELPVFVYPPDAGTAGHASLGTPNLTYRVARDILRRAPLPLYRWLCRLYYRRYAG